MNERTYINSVGGIGDILFSDPIFRHYWNKEGLKPIVVIHNHMMWIKDYIDSAEFTDVCPKQFETGSLFHNERMINLRYANQIYRGLAPDDHGDLENMMLDKYRLLGLGEELWKTLNVNLNAKGYELFKLDGEYVRFVPGGSVIVRNFDVINNNSQAGNIFIHPKNIFNNFMREIQGFSVIDWWYMMMCARENHHVSTSTFFLMQAIKNKFPDWNAPCYIYPRPNHDGLRGISQLKPDFNLIRVTDGQT